MTTGFDFSERYFPGDDVTDMLYRQPGMWLSARYRPCTTGWEAMWPIPVVTSIPLPCLAAVITGESYLHWIQREFIEPLTLQEIVLEPDAVGTGGF